MSQQDSPNDVGAARSTTADYYLAAESLTKDSTDAVDRKLNKYQSRLDAEMSIGVVAALLGGFAFSFIQTGADLDDLSTAEEWMFYLPLTLCGAMNFICVIIVSFVYWSGMHLLSASFADPEQEIRVFSRFWKDSFLRKMRYGARWLFISSVPCFLCSTAIAVYDITDNGGLLATVVLCYVLAIVLMMYCIKHIQNLTVADGVVKVA